MEDGDRWRREGEQRRLRPETDQAGRHHRDPGFLLGHDVHNRCLRLHPEVRRAPPAAGDGGRVRRSQRLLRQLQEGSHHPRRHAARVAPVRQPGSVGLEQEPVPEDRRGSGESTGQLSGALQARSEVQGRGHHPVRPAVAGDPGDPVRAALLHVHLEFHGPADVQPRLHPGRVRQRHGQAGLLFDRRGIQERVLGSQVHEHHERARRVQAFRSRQRRDDPGEREPGADRRHGPILGEARRPPDAGLRFRQHRLHGRSRRPRRQQVLQECQRLLELGEGHVQQGDRQGGSDYGEGQHGRAGALSGRAHVPLD